MDNPPKIGQFIIDGNRNRDAIHIAVAAVTAAIRLHPGQHVGLLYMGDLDMVGPADLANVGIVDPYLTEPVEVGQRFWLFLYPNTVTSLRHVWTHPVFAKAAAEARGKLQ